CVHQRLGSADSLESINGTHCASVIATDPRAFELRPARLPPWILVELARACIGCPVCGFPHPFGFSRSQSFAEIFDNSVTNHAVSYHSANDHASASCCTVEAGCQHSP